MTEYQCGSESRREGEHSRVAFRPRFRLVDRYLNCLELERLDGCLNGGDSISIRTQNV